MRVLGIDLGLRADNPAAWALVDFPHIGRVTVLDYAEIKPRASSWQARASEVGLSLLKRINTIAPDLVSYEAAHMEKNAQVLRKLSCVEGMILLAAAAHSIPTQDVQPTQAKVALASDAKATKQMMIDAAKLLYKVNSGDHIADAIGHALAGEGLFRRAQLLATHRPPIARRPGRK